MVIVFLFSRKFKKKQNAQGVAFSKRGQELVDKYSCFLPSAMFHKDSQNVSNKTDPISPNGDLLIVVLFVNFSSFQPHFSSYFP